MNLRKQLSSYIALNNYVEAIRENTSSVVLTDAIHNGLTGLQLKGSEVKNKPETFLDSVVAKGKTELKLPIERYDVLEYLESTGTQYIDTGYALTTDNFEISGSGLKRQDTASVFFGARNTTSPYIGILEVRTSSGLLSFWTGVAWAYFTASTNKKYDFKMACTSELACTVSCSGFADKTFTATQTYVNGMNINLFGNNPFASANSSVVLYAFSIKDNGVLVRDLVPVRRKSDGMLGMYDKVSGAFLTNAGTGEFVAGNVIDTFSVYLPEEYTWLDYLQSDGASYLIIPYHVNNKTVFYCRYNEIQKGPSTASAVFGVTTSPDVSKANNGILRLSNGSSPSNFNRMGWGDSTTGSVIDVDAPHNLNTWYEVLYDQNKLYQDGVLYATSATSNDTEWFAEYDLGIFARNGESVTMPAVVKISSVWVKENGKYKINLIPARRNSDNVLGMYDTVSGQFFINQGTGSFIAGPKIVPTPTPTIPVDIWCNNGVLKLSPNFYWTEYKGYQLSQVDGITVTENTGVNVSGMVDCRTIKSFKITTASPQGAFRIFKYKADNTFINAAATANIGDIITFEDNVGFFRIQYNFTSIGVNTENILIYAYNLNGIYVDGTVETLQDSTDLTAKVQTLLGIDNYQDTHNVLDGTITRNVGVKILNGTESWGRNSYGDFGYRFYLILSKNRDWTTVLKCNAYKGIPYQGGSSVGPNNTVFFAGITTTESGCFIRDDRFTTVNDWKQYLAEQYANGTPVVIIYPLEEPTTETVSSQKLLKNPVTVTEASIDNLEVTTTETEHTVPTPDYPLDIVCNNGVLKLSPNSFNADSSNVKIGYWINNNTGEEVSNDSNFLINGYIPVKSNTSYVAYGRRKTDNILSKWNRIAWYDSDKNYISTSPYTQNTIGLGISPSNAAYARFSSNPTANIVTQDTVDSFNWTFREGTQEYTKFIPYNNIIVEGTPETVTITGKNLYDVTKDTTGKYIDASGNIGDDSRACYSDLIPVKEGESYTYSGICKSSSGSSNAKRIHGYINGIWNQQIQILNININKPFSYTFTIPTGINGIRISHWTDDTYTQVEESSRPTKYEEYYQTSFAPEDLLKLGDYQDVQDVINSIKSKKIGAKVLDGTENWQNISGYMNISKTDLNTNSTVLPNNSTNIICSHFETKVNLFVDGIGVGGSYVNFKYDSLFTTLAEWQQYLADQYTAGTPVIIVYPLADAVEETVESRDVFITSGTNTIERNSEYVSGGDITVEYKKLR